MYLTPFINTKDVGPVVLEIPPADDGSITGTVMDVWQCADKDGRLLDGGSTYRLTVPVSAPVRQYWSATVYDRATTHPSGMPDGRVARPRRRDSRRMLTGRWTSTSGPRHQPARNRTGFPRAPTVGSRCSSCLLYTSPSPRDS